MALSVLYMLVFMCICMRRFMRACMNVCMCVQGSICTHACGHAGLGAGNYCTVVKHHYSLICPLAPSVLLSTTSYTISTTPRTTPPTHTPSISSSTGLQDTAHHFTFLSIYPLSLSPPSFFSPLYTVYSRPRSTLVGSSVAH